jgi:formylglycine-generating enzyme required for sulfatase activity
MTPTAPVTPDPMSPAPPEAGSAEPEREVQTAAAPVARIAAAGLKECEDCPEMAMIPAGSFTMGSNSGHWSEVPAHPVTITRPFALGKYEVTTGQWQACVQAGACAPIDEMDQGNPRAPMRGVSWDDALSYVTWLSELTGKPYRLPTEAEWEYAARAGTDTAFWWGEEIGQGHAACTDCDGPEPKATPTQVGGFPANPFGLHDMHGNVMEWVADCWFPNHEGAPEHGASRLRPGCMQRVLRGGSWSNDHTYATASSRLSYDAGLRYPTNGFRVARDLK